MLSIIVGVLSIAEDLRKEEASEQPIGWRKAELTHVFGDAAVQIRVRRESADGWPGPSLTSR